MTKKFTFSDKAFVPFIMAGDPNLKITKELIIAAEKAGADLIEIGIPFSDPVAEGPTIQKSDIRALASGTTTDKIFQMLEEVKDIVKIPIVFMTYINPIFTYGADKFMRKCKEVGIKGVIVPDMPFEEKGELSEECKKYEILLISLIAPTSETRIKEIASEAEGFLYCVSSLGVTGVRKDIKTNIGDIIKLAKEYTDIPCLIGFGISTPEQGKEMSKISDGVIVGSAIINILEKYGENSVDYVYEYIKKMKESITGK